MKTPISRSRAPLATRSRIARQRRVGRLLSLCLCWCLGLAGIVTQVLAAGPTAPAGAKFENYDRRQIDLAAKPAASGAATAAMSPLATTAATQLGREVPGVRVDRDPILNAPKFIASNHAFLTGTGSGVMTAASVLPKAEAGVQTVRDFVNAHSGLFEFRSDLLDQARITRDDTTPGTGLRTLVWQQELDGLPIFESTFKANLSAKGELMNVGSALLANPSAAADHGTPNRAALLAKPTVPAAKALAAAAATVSAPLHDEETLPADEPQGATKVQHFQPKFHLKGKPEARLVWLPMDAGTLRLCWQTLMVTRSNGRLYLMLVDAQTGEVLVRHSLTNEGAASSQYTVFTGDSPTPMQPGLSSASTNTQPAAVSRQTVTITALNTTASPDGWVPANANITVGNNVDAHLDTNNDDVADTGSQVTGSPFHVFNPSLNLTKAPSTNAQAAVVNLFYWNNWMHDTLYGYGFTETADNFQTSNYGRGGNEGDAVQADGQDASVSNVNGSQQNPPVGAQYNNANFSTPPSGDTSYAPRMQMYLFNGPSPYLDGCYDATVMCHEYTHGLSNRLVGGGVGISNLASLGLGEGWSDFVAMTLLSNANQDINGTFLEGAYVTRDFGGNSNLVNYYFGVRHYPYCTDMSKDPFTFKDIDPSKASAHTGVPISPAIPVSPTEVHSQGEVWCAMLMDMRANLIAKYGYAKGNPLAMQIVVDGLKATPANPNFVQARDAIFQADMNDNNGANHAEIDDAFARRGLGTNATAPDSSTTTGVVEDYAESSAPEVAITYPANGKDYAQFYGLEGTASDGGLGGSGIVANDVSLTLVDNASGQYWNGTGFTNTESFLTAPVASDGTWSYTGALPSGTTLRAGSYTLTATAADNDNNVSTARSGVSQIVFSVEAADPPDVTVTTPAAGSFLQAFGQVTGTAVDNSQSGIQGNIVDLNLYNVASSQYWDGNGGWSDTAVLLIASYNPSTQIWTYNGKLPSAATNTLRQGQYTLSAYAYDNTNKVSQANASNSIQFDVDNIPPTLVFNYPADGSTIATLESPTGTAPDDNSGTAIVDLYLHRDSDNTYWNGSQWVANSSTPPALAAVINSDGSWTYNQGLPLPGNNSSTSLINGTYEITAVAQDKAGNKTQLTNHFTEDFAYTWTGATIHDSNPNNDSDSWATAANWYPAGVPGAGDKVVINNGDAVDLGGDHVVRAFVLGGGSSVNNYQITVTGTGSALGNGALNGTTFTVTPTASVTIDTSASPFFNSATLTNSGTTVVMASNANNQGSFNLQASTISNVQGGVIQLATDEQAFTSYASQSSLVNAGTITKTVGTGVSNLGNIDFTNNATGVFGAATGTLELTSGNTTLNSGSTVTGPGLVLFDTAMTINGTLNVTAPLHFQNAMTFNAATLKQGSGGALRWDASSWSGAVSIPAGSSVYTDTTGSPFLIGLTLNNSGQLTFYASNAASAGVANAQGSTINNLSGGTVQVTRDGTVLQSYATVSNLFNKAGGTIIKTAAATGRSDINITLDNAGTVTAAAGTLAFDGGGTAVGSTGTFNAAVASSHIEFAGNAGGSAFTLKAGAIFTGPGPVLVTNGGVTLAGAVKVGTTTAAAGGVLLTGGTIDGTGSLTVVAGDGPFAVAGGQFNSTLNLNTGATMTVDTSANAFLINGIVNNAGTITLTASIASNVGQLYLQGATINNQSGGLIQLGRDGTIFTSYAVQSSIVNSGTITKTGGTGVTDLGGVDFTNQASGVLGAAKGTLELTSGAVTFNSGSTIGGAAITEFETPITVNGTLNVKANTHFQNAVTYNAGLLVQGTGGVLHYNAGTWGGTVTVPSGTTLAVDTSGTPFLVNATLNNLGTLAVLASDANNPGTFYCQSSTINNQSGGVIQMSRLGSVFTSYAAQSLINNSGTLVKTTGTGVTDVGAIDLTNLAAGVIGANTGSLTVSSGAVTLNSGGRIAGPGKVLFTSDATFNGSTTATTEVHLQSGTMTFANSGALVQGAGGSLHLDSGSVVGTWNIPSGTTFIVDTTGLPYLNNGGTLNNSGTLSLVPSNTGSPGTFYGVGAVFNNLSGGVIQLTQDGTAFTTYASQASLYNTGTITKTGGTGTSDVGPVTFYCHGTLSAPTAGTTLLASGGVTFDGTGSTVTGAGSITSPAITLNGPVNVATGGTLAFSTGTLTGAVDSNNKPLGSINGPGTFLLTGGTVTGTVNLGTTSVTTLNNTGNLTFTPLTLNNAGTMTITGGTAPVEGTSTTFNNLQGASLVVQSNVYLQNSNNAPSFVNAGTIKLGTTKPVVATTDWSVTQTSTGLLQVYIAGTNASTPQFSQLKVLDAVTLGGTLEADLASGYTPANKGQFANVLAFASHTGDFANFTQPKDPAGTKLTKLTSATGITLTAYDVPVINSQLTATANDGGTFSYQITATNLPTSYNATNLPAGLSIDTSTGVISGTLQAAGTYSIGLVATNLAGDGKATLVLTVSEVKPVVTSAAALTANAQASVTYQITGTHNPTSYAATSLPPGLTVNTTTGLISGKPTTQGAYTATVSAINSAGTGTLQVKFTINEALPVINSATTASANVGATFSYQITATNSPTSYSASGNPPGVSTNKTTGLITGKPTKTGTYQVTITAANSGGTSAAVVVTITVKAAPVITSATNATATEGKAFSYQITALNTPTSYSANGLPSGVSSNKTTGAISGTPKVTGTFKVALTATNADGTGTATLTLVVAAAPPSVTSAKATTTVGAAFTYQIVATNTPTSYGASGLPAGLSVNTSTGKISGTATTAATSQVTISAKNAAGTGTGTLTLTVNKTSGVKGSGGSDLAKAGSGATSAATKADSATLAVAGPLRIVSAMIVDAQAGKPFSFQIASSREVKAFAAGELPDGLDLDAGTGVISGTPAGVGTHRVDLAVTDHAGETAKAVLTLKIDSRPVPAPVITGATVATVQAGQAWSYQVTASGDPVAYEADVLPEGLSIDPDAGLIAGTPTAAGVYEVALGAENQGGTGTATLVLTVAPAPLPVVNVAATVARTTAGSGAPGVVTFSIPEALPDDLTAAYELAGSAVNGVDYHLLRGTVTIKAGRTRATVRVVPQGVVDGGTGKAVELSLSPGKDYTAGASAAARVEILPGR